MKTALTWLGRAVELSVWTPTLWGTIAGAVLAGLGHLLVGPVLLLIVGWGGVGIAVHIGVQEDRDSWRIDTVIEAIVEALRWKRPITLLGLVLHLPQAIAGVLLLWLA